MNRSLSKDDTRVASGREGKLSTRRRRHTTQNHSEETAVNRTSADDCRQDVKRGPSHAAGGPEDGSDLAHGGPRPELSSCHTTHPRGTPGRSKSHSHKTLAREHPSHHPQRPERDGQRPADGRVSGMWHSHSVESLSHRKERGTDTGCEGRRRQRAGAGRGLRLRELCKRARPQRRPRRPPRAAGTGCREQLTGTGFPSGVVQVC